MNSKKTPAQANAVRQFNFLAASNAEQSKRLLTSQVQQRLESTDDQARPPTQNELAIVVFTPRPQAAKNRRKFSIR